VVAGCGGGNKQESYRKDFQPVNRDLVQLTRGVGRTFTTSRGKSDPQIGRDFGRLADRLGKIEGNLKDLDPPKKFAAGQRALLRAIAPVKRSLRGIETAARDKNVSAARRPLIELVTSTFRLSQARQRLSQAVTAGGG
jgi:hypothetical protein